MDIKVTIEFTIKNAFSEEDLKHEEMTVQELTEFLIKSEGLHGIVEDDYKIVEIKEILEEV